MWKAVTRSFCDVVERRVGFTVFRCDASKSNPPDARDKSYTAPYQSSCIVQRWKHICPLKYSKSSSIKSSGGPQDEKHQENKQHEEKWDEPHINPSWIGAMKWSTALVLGWYICQPFGWYHTLKDSRRRCLLRRKGVSFTGPFANPSIQSLQILPLNSTHEIVDGRLSLYNSTSDSGFTGLGLDDCEEQCPAVTPTPSLSSSTDTGVSIEDGDDLFAHCRGPFTPEEALDEVSRVFAAASQTFSGDVENKLGMFYMEKKQHSEALRHFRRASHHDNANAAYNIGQCYELGLGTAQNMKKAAKWYKIASDRGHSIAMYNLAIFFARGLGGLTENKDQAHELLQAASNLGLKEAEKALQLVLAQSPPSQHSEPNATQSLLEMLGVEDDKTEDLTVHPTSEYPEPTLDSTRSYFNFSYLDCMDLTFTPATDQEHKNNEKPQFYDGFGLKNRWGLNRLCFKLPIDHDTVVA